MMAALLLLLSMILIILLVIYLLLTWKLDYWTKRNVPHLQPQLLFGNYKDFMLLKKTFAEVAQDICRQFPNEPYIGTYFGTEPALLVQDPELLKAILAKDFPYFSGRELAKYEHCEPVNGSMFFTYGDKWKVTRQNLRPLFSSAKLKNMFPLVLKCVKQFEGMLEYETKISTVLEARNVMSRFTMECVCSMAFGIDANVMGKDTGNNPFKKIGNLVFQISNIRGIFIYARVIWPALFYGVGLKLFPRSITDFFQNVSTEVFQSRGYKPSPRNDFVDMLMTLKEQGTLTSDSLFPGKNNKVSVKVDDEYLAAQCVLFFSAGYETSATTASALLYRLARDQEVQQKVVYEIKKYLQKRGGNIEYDCVTELPYLEACVNESMRLNPVLGILAREVIEPYVLPSGLHLEPGLRVHIPVYHLHMNPKYFPNPEDFKPERFLPENKDKITPYTFMPFGEGQRICLGMRVSKMQMMPGLITVLRRYRLEVKEHFPTSIQFEPRSLVMMSKTGLPLKFIPREKSF